MKSDISDLRVIFISINGMFGQLAETGTIVIL